LIANLEAIPRVSRHHRRRGPHRRRVCPARDRSAARLRLRRTRNPPPRTATSTCSTNYSPGRRLGWEIEQLADELAAVFVDGA